MVKAILSTTSLLLLATTVAGVCETYSYTTCADHTVHWFDPRNGVVCDPLDCGGGMAPVKYDVPCCAAYTGTKPCVSTTSTLSCWKPSTAFSSATASASSVATTSDAATPEPSTVSSGRATATSLRQTSGNATAPATTDAPTPSTGSTTESSTATTSDSSAPVSTNIAGEVVGSFMAAAGAALGAVVLV
ncbi:hypothetical protein N7468_004143 [Penicillium chermesinum]|uniref:Cell wall protein n=1 Tax=Penicillium chermesinum TaxID=63820 RepID=A0A9W9P7S4_9EURO|nr:uncharacterized protein N7468_004143 [Penicillium chermesinum]KAJ5239524.1 hypothetical protein N7468_004143 [Penicillium chermesinum]KAJ6141218.1 hypothetical protein N7470_010114 [Penicillium chermesinum]